jgi:capsular polysaccharide biosynthesis protein
MSMQTGPTSPSGAERGVKGVEIPVEIAELDDWTVEEEIHTGLPSFARGGVRIDPSLTRHRDVTVTGLDWLPIKNGQVALVLHSPELYFTKVNVRQALRREGQSILATTGPIRELPGTSILIGGVEHLYHWLIDFLPRLMLAQRLMGRLPRILLNRPGRIQLETLRLLGIREWEEVGDHESVRCEDLWIPSMLARLTVPHPAVLQMLRESFRPTRELERRDIYLSRRDATTRQLVNEDELMTVLPGFETHLTAHLTLQEQVNLFASVDRLVAVHGNGMTNQIFCRPGTKVYEIAVADHRVTSMYRLAELGGLKHHFVPASVAVMGRDGRELLGQWRVDVSAMRDALQSDG